MNIINAENITKSYTGRKLFLEASFYVQENEKIGIIGINGTGKSTLLKIIAGLEEADEGSVVRARGLVTGYLDQAPEFKAGLSLLDACVQTVSGGRSGEAGDYVTVSDVKSLLTRFDLTDFDSPVENLSGGQKKRLALAAVLAAPCDLLILDEPTNHLDYAAIEWLEEYLKAYSGALLLITHDRYFLDSVTKRIVEIDQGKIYSYETNYSGYLEAKLSREESAAATERKRRSILRKEIAWMQRGARARSTKQKAHIQRYEALRDRQGPAETKNLEMKSVSSRLGRTTIELEGLEKAYDGKTLIRDFSYIFLKNDRVGFVGDNGCGKTTLMKMIAGLVEPDSGKITVGQTVKMGYYSQEITFPDPMTRVIDFIRDTAEYVRTEDGLVSASAMLDRFLFPPQEQYGPVGRLSGGEKRRLMLLRVLMEAPNVLILDEPTNDLDTQTMTILEDYLDNYEGIVIAVSHDRYFLDRIVSRIFAFEADGRLTQYEGGYTDYRNKCPIGEKSISGGKVGGPGQNVNEKKAASGQKPNDRNSLTGRKTDEVNMTGKGKPRTEKKKKLTYSEEREYAVIGDLLAEIEERIRQLDRDIEKNACNSGKLAELMAEKEKAEELLLEKMERWEYLEEKMS